MHHLLVELKRMEPMSLSMTVCREWGPHRTISAEERLTIAANLPTPRQIEQQLEDREAKLLSENLLWSRGLNPDHEPMLRGILQEHFLRQAQQRKNMASVLPASRSRSGAATDSPNSSSSPLNMSL
jgi:hypothetical protein